LAIRLPFLLDKSVEIERLEVSALLPRNERLPERVQAARRVPGFWRIDKFDGSVDRHASNSHGDNGKIYRFATEVDLYRTASARNGHPAP